MADVIWLARHGNRQDFVDPEWYRSAQRPYDPGLSEDGHEQAERLARRLRQERISVLFASPYLRCVQTAAPVAHVLGLPIRLEPGIGEHLNPEWFTEPPERLNTEELRELYPRVALDYQPALVPEFPETTEQAFQRSAETARRLADRHEGALLLVGHGISVTGTARELGGGLTEELAAPLCGLFKLVRSDGRWQHELIASTDHLDAAIGADRLI